MKFRFLISKPYSVKGTGKNFLATGSAWASLKDEKTLEKEAIDKIRLDLSKCIEVIARSFASNGINVFSENNSTILAKEMVKAHAGITKFVLISSKIFENKFEKKK